MAIRRRVPTLLLAVTALLATLGAATAADAPSPRLVVFEVFTRFT